MGKHTALAFPKKSVLYGTNIMVFDTKTQFKLDIIK